MDLGAPALEAYQFNRTSLTRLLSWYFFIFHDDVPQARGLAPIGMME
jgi:hypothetical protein